MTRDETRLPDLTAAAPSKDTPLPEPAPPRPPVPDAPVSGLPDAVLTVRTADGEKKFGWQSKGRVVIAPPRKCTHLPVQAAKADVPFHEVGHEFICACGKKFVVAVNAGGKKVLRAEEVDEVEEPEEEETP